MRRSTTVVIALAWGVGLGGTFGCLLPYLLGYWQARQPLPLWPLAQLAGGLLTVLGLVPIVWAFADFVRAGGTPVPAAAPPHLVVTGLYRHVRNPIYAGFLLLLLGQALVFGSLGLLLYAGVAWCIAALVVRFSEQPRLLRRFGADYEDYLRTVPAWIPGLRPVPPRAIAAPRLTAILGLVLAIGVLAQGLLAGAFLSGASEWYPWHEALGNALVFPPLVSLVAALVLLWRHPDRPSALVTRVFLLVLVLVTIASAHGGRELLVVHIPAAIAVVAIAVRQAAGLVRAPVVSAAPDRDAAARPSAPPPRQPRPTR